jgi:hypothetical protein
MSSVPILAVGGYLSGGAIDIADHVEPRQRSPSSNLAQRRVDSCAHTFRSQLETCRIKRSGIDINGCARHKHQNSASSEMRRKDPSASEARAALYWTVSRLPTEQIRSQYVVFYATNKGP